MMTSLDLLCLFCSVQEPKKRLAAGHELDEGKWVRSRNAILVQTSRTQRSPGT